MIAKGSTAIAQRFKSTVSKCGLDIRFYPQMRKYVGHACTIIEIIDDIAIVEFQPQLRFVWSLNALKEL